MCLLRPREHSTLHIDRPTDRPTDRISPSSSQTSTSKLVVHDRSGIMSHRFYQLQTEAAHASRSSSPHRSSAHKSSHRPQPQVTTNYAQRTSTSSDSSSSSGASSYGSSYNYSSADSQKIRYSMDQPQPRVEVMRCSRCAKCVETITTSRSGDDYRRVSNDDATASGMVRFGHNLYYCDRCARLVGYK
jgi:hypothetical protein